jgi:hypothetical protein
VNAHAFTRRHQFFASSPLSAWLSRMVSARSVRIRRGPQRVR